VPVAMRPIPKTLLVCPIRFRVRVSPITTKPAKVKMFMPKRMSLVSNGLTPSSVAVGSFPQMPTLSRLQGRATVSAAWPPDPCPLAFPELWVTQKAGD
jgi:hypothetical protein